MCSSPSATSCSPVYLQKERVAWPSDFKNKFVDPAAAKKALVAGYYRQAITNTAEQLDMYNMSANTIKDEDLIVWMRTSAMPNFKKLHRIINQV